MLAAVLDHLWQSTLLALGAGLLAAGLHKARAGVRYGLWLAASLKFLVPFAALAMLGRYLAPAGLIPVRAAPEAALIKAAARPLAEFPFARVPMGPTPLAAPTAPSVVHAPAHAILHVDFAALLLTVWAIGSAAILVRWLVRWGRVQAMARGATPLDWRAPMPVLASSSLMEPGLIGLWRAVLVVPQTLPERLSPAEIDAIVAHEAAHLRRGDNVTAALHMLVEALFWFHPLVWWIGARLIAERERACDEAVVGAGHDRAAYARSLVESARLYLHSPLSCVAGASGSDLKRRVETIMTAPLSAPLSLARKTLLAVAGALVLATPVMAGMLASPAGQAAVAGVQAAASRLPIARALVPSLSSPQPGADDEPIKTAAPPLAVAETAAVQTSAPAPTDRASPGTEDAARRWILALQTHQPALGDITPAFEQSLRQQWAGATQTFRVFGALKALKFQGVTSDGEDAYEADFAHAKIEVTVSPLTADGKLASLAWTPIWDRDVRGDAVRQAAPQTTGVQPPTYRWGDLAPRAEAAPAAAVQPAPAPPKPVVVAQTSGAPASQPLARGDAKSRAQAFVESYAALNNAKAAARWNGPLCVRVVGLPRGEEAAIRNRVVDVARAVGLKTKPADCGPANVQIAFTADPQEALDIAKTKGLLGDSTSGTGAIDKATLPIQAWYFTNGSQYAAADTGDLKVKVLWQNAGGGPPASAIDGGYVGGAYITPGSDMASGARNGDGANSGWAPMGSPPGPGRGGPYNPPRPHRALLNALVIVDIRKVDKTSLGLISDYVAMLALSQPRALGQCNALPSVTDLFAGDCPGRGAPDGLTPADAAYLTALYAQGLGYQAATEDRIAERMAKMIGPGQMASR